MGRSSASVYGVEFDRSYRYASPLLPALYLYLSTEDVDEKKRIGANWCVNSYCGRLHMLCVRRHDNLQPP